MRIRTALLTPYLPIPLSSANAFYVQWGADALLGVWQDVLPEEGAQVPPPELAPFKIPAKVHFGLRAVHKIAAGLTGRYVVQGKPLTVQAPPEGKTDVVIAEGAWSGSSASYSPLTDANVSGPLPTDACCLASLSPAPPIYRSSASWRRS